MAAETFWLAKFETIIIKTHKFWSFLILYHASKFSQNYKLSNANFMLIIRPLNELISRDWFFSTRNALFCWLLPAPALLHHSLSLSSQNTASDWCCALSRCSRIHFFHQASFLSQKLCAIFFVGRFLNGFLADLFNGSVDFCVMCPNTNTLTLCFRRWFCFGWRSNLLLLSMFYSSISWYIFLSTANGRGTGRTAGGPVLAAISLKLC